MRTLRQDSMAGSSDLAALFWMAWPRVPFSAKWFRAVAVAFSWGAINSMSAWLKSPCTQIAVKACSRSGYHSPCGRQP